MIVAWNIATRSAGTALPTMIMPGVKGDTRSWSKVPCSFSRATESELTIRVLTVVMIATRQGMICRT